MPGIIGTDDRRTESSVNWPWSAIGRLNVAETGTCTGTLIAPRLVLTAAHCLLRRRDRGIIRPQSVHFLAAYDRGKYVFHATAESLIVPSSIRPGMQPKDFITDDWAIVVLDKPVPLRPIPLDEAAPAAPRPAMRAGYSRDRAHVLTLVRTCQLLGLEGDGALYTHDCDATLGDSGSPILIGDATAPRIAAINIGIAGLGDTAIDLAVPVASFADAVSDAVLSMNQPVSPAISLDLPR